MKPTRRTLGSLAATIPGWDWGRRGSIKICAFFFWILFPFFRRGDFARV